MSKRWSSVIFVALIALIVGALGFVTVSAQTYGTGWTAQYFANTTLEGAPVYTESLPAGINIDWGTGSPNPAVPNDNWSARFTSIQLFNAGTYEFVVASDDGVRVYIDNVLVLDRFFGRVLTVDRFQQTLTAGSHSLTVEYLELIDRAAIQFQWFQLSAAQPTQALLPTSVFVPQPVLTVTPTITPIPPTPLPPIPPGALTGTVIRAQVLLARQAPFFGAPVVGRLLRGQTYQVLGRDADARWFLLQLSGFQGWVWGYYLFVNGNEFNAPVVNAFITAGAPASETGVVGQTEAVMRLRAEPNVLSAQIGRIPWGDLLPILGRTAGGDWYQVLFRGTVGWVAAAYIRIIEGDINTVPVR